MKSGMKVQLDEFGETQVIGELKDHKFTSIWGIAYQGGYKMKPEGKLLRDVLDACQRADIIESSVSVLDENDLQNRLDWIKEASEKINKESLVC